MHAASTFNVSFHNSNPAHFKAHVRYKIEAGSELKMYTHDIMVYKLF